MEVTIEKKISIKHCNDCPFFYVHTDTSVCFDSFDEPNYDWFCTHEKAVNSGTELEQYNENGKVSLGGSYNNFAKCEIPTWCPLKK